MKELMFQKELTLINQISQEDVWFIIIGILKILIVNLWCVCNKCNEISMMADELDNIKILNVKDVDYGCVLWNTTRHGAVNRLNNSKLHVKGTLWISILLQIKHFLN